MGLFCQAITKRLLTPSGAFVLVEGEISNIKGIRVGVGLGSRTLDWLAQCLASSPSPAERVRRYMAERESAVQNG